MNSGNPKSDVESWAKGNKFEWPTLVDEFNETENSLGIKISLENISQFRLVTPEGTVRVTQRDAAAIRKDVEQLLPGAKMFFDGITVPEKLKPFAREVELGQYDTAIGEIAARAQKDEAAKEMYERLKPIAESAIERAKACEGEGKKYAAYREYSSVAAWFKKTDYAKTASAAIAELKKDKDVKNELAAATMLGQAKKLLASQKKSERDAAVGMLKALQKKYPGTEACAEAERLASAAE